jgi:predicted AAA+ superfamily ATPase
MLAHYHAQTWNGSELARAFGVTHKTRRRYLDALTAALVVTQLKPWFANIGKRQVKAPKVYITDSGLLHTLLDIKDQRDLDRHPKVGASWEGFLLKETIQALQAEPDECYFWATHTGAELDLLWIRGRKRLGFESKRTVAPKLTRSMHTATRNPFQPGRLTGQSAQPYSWTCPLGRSPERLAIMCIMWQVQCQTTPVGPAYRTTIVAIRISVWD